MNLNRAVIRRAAVAAALLSTGLFYQNCARVSLKTSGLGSSEVIACLPQDAPGLAPTLKYGWSLKSDPANPISAFNQVMAAPVVGDIDGDGIPEIIFSSFSGATDSLYDSPGVLRVLDGRTGALKASLSTPGLAPFGSTTPLLIDLAGDGTKQIIYTTDGTKVVALNADLTVRWTLDLPASIGNCWGGFAAADLDGNGRAEIIADRFVLEESAARTPSVRFATGAGAACTTFATSLDPAKPAQMQVVSGDGVYDAKGNRLFAYANGTQSYAGGYLAAADISPAHPGQEIVISRAGKVGLFDGTTGELIWETAVDQGRTCGGGVVGNGGPANIGSFLGNGHLQVGVATGKYYSVYDENGRLVWNYGSNDCTSAITGATLFDFNGDGKPEIIYGDQNFLRIFDAANGNVLFKVPNPSGTLMEYPVVADVDGDGDSELVVVTNNIFNNDPNVPTFYGDATAAERAAIDAVPPGVRVFKAATDAAWMPTRAVWNQYSYFINNVTDDLKSVSSTPNTASGGANLFRQNLLSGFKDACAK